MIRPGTDDSWRKVFRCFDMPMSKLSSRTPETTSKTEEVAILCRLLQTKPIDHYDFKEPEELTLGAADFRAPAFQPVRNVLPNTAFCRFLQRLRATVEIRPFLVYAKP